ncbi:MAG: hypothetical protein ACR2RL_24170 [Gammaproteobacteria bacterium]
MDPGAPAPGNLCAEVDPDMPLDWARALDRLDGSRLMREYLSDDYIDLYCATKRAERARFFDRPSRREMAPPRARCNGICDDPWRRS